MTRHQVVVIVRDGCHLCADAVSVATRVCAELDAELTTADVDAEAGLAQHSDHVPVTLVDGRQLAIWFLDEDRLRQALAQRPASLR